MAQFERIRKFQLLIDKLTNQPKEETMTRTKPESTIEPEAKELIKTMFANVTGINPNEVSVATSFNQETKEQKFSRLATARLNVILKRLRTLTNLANTNDYSYTPEQVQKLVAHLENGVGQVREAFAEDVVEEVKI